VSLLNDSGHVLLFSNYHAVLNRSIVVLSYYVEVGVAQVISFVEVKLDEHIFSQGAGKIVMFLILKLLQVLLFLVGCHDESFFVEGKGDVEVGI